MWRLRGTFAILMCASAGMAGPLAPCIRAVGSPSGDFLVITDAEFSHPLPAMAERVTLRVIGKETFVNDPNYKVVSPNTYWSSDGWSVVLRKGDSYMSSCPMSLISDNGVFLILLQGYGFDSALRIYRRPEQGHNGVLVRDIALSEIWPEHEWRNQPATVMDGNSPQWFAGGTFEFSSDSRVLIHKTRWGNVVHLHLSDGVVSPWQQR
jgi:hypothetical protein